MATEIERKFLVNGTPWLEAQCEAHHYLQGYLSLDAEKIIRVRCKKAVDCLSHRDKAQAWITIKGRMDGISCREYEYVIPWQEAKLLLECSAQGSVIEKTRYHIPYAAHRWDVDVFLGENAGLVVAEVELGSEAEHFERPAWLGQEVTHELRYKNAKLCTCPYSSWDDV